MAKNLLTQFIIIHEEKKNQNEQLTDHLLILAFQTIPLQARYNSVRFKYVVWVDMPLLGKCPADIQNFFNSAFNLIRN